jgi:hypothetical protein
VRCGSSLDIASVGTESYESATVRSDPGNVVPTAVRLMMTGVSGPIAGVPVAEPTVEPATIVTVNNNAVPA